MVYFNQVHLILKKKYIFCHTFSAVKQLVVKSFITVQSQRTSGLQYCVLENSTSIYQLYILFISIFSSISILKVFVKRLEPSI